MSTETNKSASPHILPPLPYAEDALNPAITAKTVGFHYEKHHKGYVDTLNKLVEGTQFVGLPLKTIIMETAGDDKQTAIFNNAAQAWNHSFYWTSLKPNGGGEPPAPLKEEIETSFGSVDACKKELAAAAATQFGSGWAWLVLNRGKLQIVKTSNAETPMTLDLKPLLAIDVWEHAYYLDYQNKRAEYIQSLIDKLINWEFAAENLG